MPFALMTDGTIALQCRRVMQRFNAIVYIFMYNVLMRYGIQAPLKANAAKQLQIEKRDKTRVFQMNFRMEFDIVKCSRRKMRQVSFRFTFPKIRNAILIALNGCDTINKFLQDVSAQISYH